jgi:hypothetical protein
MSGWNEQRKPGTTRGSPRRSRTAKASRISRHAAKSRCAREWGGWGRLSDDGSGQNNPNLSEDPWGGGLPTLHGGAPADNRPGSERDNRGYDAVHEGRTQTSTLPAHVGSRLKLGGVLGRPRLKCQPSSRTGENPPYGMIGGIEETSASFEARSAPRSYPTAGGEEQSSFLVRCNPSGGRLIHRAARKAASLSRPFRLMTSSGRSGPAFPSSALQAGRYPGTRFGRRSCVQGGSMRGFVARECEGEGRNYDDPGAGH